jgi:hypothetical protein
MRTHPLMVAGLTRQHSAELQRTADRDRLAQVARRRDPRPVMPPIRGRRRTYFRRFRAITMRLI